MRLIDAQLMVDRNELRLVERIDEPYAILSHTWGRQDSEDSSWGHDEDEILFADVGVEGIEEKKPLAWGKIRCACVKARERGLDHVWVDTCCFNKESSAELDESINAMFTWYKQSKICLAFLAGFEGPLDPRPEKQKERLKGCRWFTRGWTLQELIAPEHVIFYDQNWVKIGSKAGLADALKDITGIDGDALQGKKPLSSFTVARKMHWAAQRKTKRPEDRAYSLLGIFGVNMTLLYGIGGKTAFRRLQEEIIRTTTDMTVFAWESGDIDDRSNQFCSMFADSPDQFDGTRHMESMILDGHFTITNRGLLLDSSTLRVIPEELRGSSPPLVLLLGTIPKDDKVECHGIYLQKIGSAIYVRDGTQGLAKFDESKGAYKLKPVPRHQCYITLSSQDFKDTLLRTLRRPIRVPSNLLPLGLGSVSSAQVVHHVPESTWDYHNCWFLHVSYNRRDTVTAVEVKVKVHDETRKFAVLFDRRGVDPRAYILDIKDSPSVTSIFSPSRRFDSAPWDDLMIHPSMQKSHHDVTAREHCYRISASLEHETVESWGKSTKICSLRLDVQLQPSEVTEASAVSPPDNTGHYDTELNISLTSLRRHQTEPQYDPEYHKTLPIDHARQRIYDLEQQLYRMQQQVQDLSRNLKTFYHKEYDSGQTNNHSDSKAEEEFDEVVS
ncbi:hypothetical protein JX265_011479 [Neoarthrinium moseri]|uniref:Heterokaryon incompatibility domain-containing protein n=1 Tax=Neoarthrinium moseri TaxID=1658444 RepID=A0A9P9WCG6_9PEZI|nr:hypothetical protein JX265_011479 [Neoarthrinium moseri]